MNTSIKRLLLILYGIYAWSAFLIVGLLTLILLLVTPGLRARRVIGSHGAKLWLQLAAITVEVNGEEFLPSAPAVVVANHSSYIDGVVLKAVLPVRYAFVIKKEIVKVPLAGFLLRRIGAEFVDRFNRHSGAMDARRLMRAAAQGGSLVFFPEGTFVNHPGLARFHGGAFTIAARTNAPVVPLVIHGARRILKGGTIFPVPGRIRIEILNSLTTSTTDTQARAAWLRDHSRARILQVLGEPDLIDADGVAELANRQAKNI